MPLHLLRLVAIELEAFLSIPPWFYFAMIVIFGGWNTASNVEIYLGMWTISVWYPSLFLVACKEFPIAIYLLCALQVLIAFTSLNPKMLSKSFPKNASPNLPKICVFWSIRLSRCMCLDDSVKQVWFQLLYYTNFD